MAELVADETVIIANRNVLTDNIPPLGLAEMLRTVGRGIRDKLDEVEQHKA